MKQNKKPQTYMQFLEESVGIFANLDAYSNPAKDIITWRGKNKKKMDTTLKSKDLNALVDDIVGKGNTKKDASQFAEDFDLRNDGLDDLIEGDDFGYGYEDLEEGWEYDGLDDLNEESDSDDEVQDPLTGLEEDGKDDDDGLADLLEDNDPEDDDDGEDYEELEEGAFLDEDSDDVNFEELTEGAADDDDDEEEEDDDDEVDAKHSNVTESATATEDSPISMLEEDTDDVSAISALIQEMELLEDEIDTSISYDEYNDGLEEESDVISASEAASLKEGKGKFPFAKKGDDKKKKDDDSDVAAKDDDDSDDDDDGDDDDDEDFDEDDMDDSED